jgi:putative Mg2+ transporter-C (MgtC) family protein
MDVLIDELSAGFPDAEGAASIFARLICAFLVGGLIGLQREVHGKPAGLRTHMLVALGTTLIVLAGTDAGMRGDSDAMSRVVQGIVTGMGFLGAGAILKLYDERYVLGLTTAAGMWMTAACGIAAGLGRYALALSGALLAWFVLAVLGRAERRLDQRAKSAERALEKPSTRI